MKTDDHVNWDGHAPSQIRRAIIKVGTNVVTGGQDGFCEAQVRPLARSIARLKGEGRQVVLVSSGALSLGAGKLKLDRARLHDLATRQACAAVGQSLLMHAYEKLFREHRVAIAQVLLTEDDFNHWKRHLNLRHTIEKLLKLGVLPIINENDTVSTNELELVKTGGGHGFGDNDRLAALVMSKLDADALIILTNVDGLLRPLKSSRAKTFEVIPLVTEITPELQEIASGPSAGGRGGMTTKLEAAEIGMNTGGLAVIANGTCADTLDRFFAGERVGTRFVSGARMRGKRRWIAYAAGVRGRLILNPGACDALIGGKASLLSSGVIRVENQFEPMEVVSIADTNGREFGRALINCSSQDARKLIRSQAASDNGNRNGKSRVLVTRNNIVLMEK